MATQRTFSEFMSICEAVYGSSKLTYGGVKKEPKDTRLTVTAADKKGNTKAWQNYKAGDKRYKAASHLGEDSEIDEKFSMASDTSKPQSPRPTKLPKSRERNVGRHDDWKDKPTEWGERPAAGKKLKSRASAVVQSQHRQDVETGVRKEEAKLDEVVVTRSPEVKQRAKNIKKIRDKKETLAALQQHAKLQKQGLADEVEYDGENVDEVLMVTPSAKKTTKKVVKSASKLEKPDPRDPDYVTKQREYVKAKQQEAVDYERLSSGARAATERAEAAKKAKLQRQQSDAESARTAFRTKGVPFSDAKGSGHIVNGKKVYAS
jgi:hypothetical protein